MSLRQNFIRKMHIPAILQEEFMSILFLCFSIGLSLSLYTSPSPSSSLVFPFGSATLKTYWRAARRGQGTSTSPADSQALHRTSL